MTNTQSPRPALEAKPGNARDWHSDIAVESAKRALAKLVSEKSSRLAVQTLISRAFGG